MAGIVEILKLSEEFSSVLTFNEYLTQLRVLYNISPIPNSQEFLDFLNSTIICLGIKYHYPSSLGTVVKYPHSTLVDSIISSMLGKKSSGNGLRLEEPVQTLGYSSYTQTGALRKNPNLTIVLKSPNWETLHQIIGSDLMGHIISGEQMSVLSRFGDSYIQIIGESMAKFVKRRAHYPTFKKEKSHKFRDFKKLKKDFKEILQANHTKKQDILAKLPVINRTKMFYNPLIRRRKWLSSKHPLSFPPAEAGIKIAKQILGQKSKEKYLPQLAQFFTKFTKQYQRINLGAHLNKHCPLPKDWKEKFEKNLQDDHGFDYLFSNHCKWQQACTFLVTLITKAVPLQLLGSKSNLKTLQRSVIQFLKLGTWERISCAALCSGYKFGDLKWIKEFTDSPRRLLFGKIIHWIFNDFIVPIMQSTFYITEKQHDNSVLYFFRKPLWSVILNKSKQKLEENSFFSQIPSRQAKSCQDYTQFPPAKLRVQPKPADFRPIMHFKSRIAVTPNMKLSGNNLLAGLPQILRNSLESQSEILALDYPSIVERINNFSKIWAEKGSPRLYFLTMDITKAFDSVKLPELREYMKKLKLPPISSYYKYIQLSPRASHPPQGPVASLLKMKFKKQAVNEGEFPLFQDMPLQPNSINILTSKTLINTTTKIRTIEKVLQANVIKFNRQYFKGERGVPQGLSCSPLLSNLYFSELENQVDTKIRSEFPNDLLFMVRLHDDYLMLSDNQSAIEALLTEMLELAKKEKFSFGKDKITSNIEAPWIKNKAENIEGWIGLDISKELSVVPHVSEKASQIISSDFLSGKETLADLKNKLVKMTNVTINLLRNRASASEDELERALEKLMKLQAHRYLYFLKFYQKFYKKIHSVKRIGKIIVRVLKYSAQLAPKISNFLVVSLQQFEEAFKKSSLYPVSRMLEKYLKNLQASE